MSSIALPALDVRPQQQQPNVLQQFGSLMGLRNMLGAQQLQQGQLQMQQMELQDQQTMRRLAPNFITKDDSGKVTGYDTEGYMNGLLQAGVNPVTVSAMRNQYATTTKNLADAGEAQLNLQKQKNDQAYQLLEGVRSVASAKDADPQAVQNAYQTALPKLQQLGFDTSKYPTNFQQVGLNGLDQFEAGLGVHAQVLADAKTQSETAANTAKAANESAEAALNQIKLNLAKNSKPGDFDSQIDQIFAPTGQSAGSNRMAKALVNGALSRGDFEGAKQILDQAYQSQQELQKDIAVQTNPQVQAGKIQVAQAEAQARMAMEGMAKPGYALDPKTGQKDLMSQTEAIAQHRIFTPVTAKEVSDDTMLINRLSDVRAKIAQYDQALQGWLGSGNTVNREGEKSSIAGLLSSDKLKVGALGVELPVDRLNQLADQFNIKTLSPQAREVVASYYNAREALVGYNRVLSGSGRSSDKTLELQEQTLPSPVSADKDYAQRALRQFKSNLQIVGQGLPNIPGVKTPEQWEQEVTGGNGNPRVFPQSLQDANSLRQLLGIQ